MGLVHIPLPIDPVRFLLDRVPDLIGRVDSFPDIPILFFSDVAQVLIQSKDEISLARATHEAICELAEMNHSRIDVVITDGFFDMLADDHASLVIANQCLRGRAVMLLHQVVPPNS
jgi:hypothetical protein